MRIWDQQAELKHKMKLAETESAQASPLDRDSSTADHVFAYFPVYVARDPKQELKPFYRGKQAKGGGAAPGQGLQLVDTRYYLDIFWAMEPQSLPFLVSAQAELRQEAASTANYLMASCLVQQENPDEFFRQEFQPAKAVQG